MSDLANRINAVLKRIQAAECRFQRRSVSVTVLAVSKSQTADAVAAAAAVGLNRFGENYLQEALQKMQILNHLDLEWHFIGPIQANKTKRIAENFAWVHSVDRLKIAQRLSIQRPPNLPPMNICLQVNISQETTKSGFRPKELPEVARLVAGLPGLRLRGLMAIPAPSADFDSQRQPFAQLNKLQQQLISTDLPLDTLSMGMSDDMEAAIAEGATIVRIGTAIFGPRSRA